MNNAIIGAASKKRMYHSLDGLRGVAAMFVVLWHFGSFLRPFVVSSGYLAVDLFFLMSGFVIANAYQDRLGHSLGAVRFAVLRFIRLYPLYLAGTALGLFVLVVPLTRGSHAPGAWGEIAGMAVPGLLMLPVPAFLMPTLLYPLNFPAWSLFCELVANALYGSFAKLRRGWLLPAIVACAGAGMIMAACQMGSIDGGWQWPHWWMGLIRVSFSFFLGVIGYKVQAEGRLPIVKFPLMPLFMLVGLILYTSPGVQFRVAYDLMAVLIIFPIVVWLCVVNEPRYGLRFYTLVGLISYPIYTIHGPFLLLVQLIGRHAAGYDQFNAQAAAWSPWIGLALIAALMPLSWLLAVTYDLWARRLLSRVANYLHPAPRLAPA